VPNAILIVVLPATRALTCLLLIVLCAEGIARAQSATELVVIIPGTTEFHRPGCPLVAKAGSKVTIAKRADALRRGLKEHPACFAGAAGDPSGVADPNAVKVFTQPGDKRYHRATCTKLGATRSAITLEDAGKQYWPCPVCKPPIRQRKALILPE
jgi:hypothetical protein